jgi:Zn-dependent protease
MYFIQLLTNGTNGITREGLLNVAAFLFALLVALMLHEIAHGLVALWFGDDTAKNSGRLTLNPRRHFSLIGFLMLLLVGFGWANPVPVNSSKFRRRTAGMLCVSLAGVATNFLLAFLFALPYCALYFYNGEMNEYLLYFLRQATVLTISLNISFALFNLLPLYPLDGYRLLSCFVPQQNGAMTFLRRYSLYILLGLIMMQYVPLLQNYSPLTLYIERLGTTIVNAFITVWSKLFI